MINNLENALVAAVKKTFADMLFIDVIESSETEIQEYSHIISLKILEPEYLEIVLWLPLLVKKEVAENIYGKPWGEITDVEIDDCLLELLNILAGNFLIEYFGTNSKFSISLPEILFDKSELDNSDYRNIFFDAEEKPFMVSIGHKMV